MIAWVTPTVMGQMQFGITATADLATNTPEVAAVGSAGSTTLIDQHGTTVDEFSSLAQTNFSYGTDISTFLVESTENVFFTYETTTEVGTKTSFTYPTSSSVDTFFVSSFIELPFTSQTATNFSGSGNAITLATLLGQTTTTSSYESQYKLSTTISANSSKWATTTTGDEATTFTTQATTVSVISDTTSTRAVTETIVTEDSETMVGNTFATIYLGNYLPQVFAGQEARNEGNELIIAVTAPLYLDEWDGNGIEASPYVSAATQITVLPEISSRDVAIVGAGAELSTISVDENTEELNYETTSLVSSVSSTSHNFNFFPPKSFEYTTFSVDIVSSATTWTVTPAQEIVHKGETEIITTYVTNPRTTTMSILDDGRTYSALRVGPQNAHISTTAYAAFDSYETSSTSNAALQAAGNTTYRRDDALGLIGPLNVGIEEDERIDMGACYVVKSCGVSLGNSFASVFTANCPEFSVASSDCYAFRDRQGDENGSIGLGLSGQGFANTAGIRVLKTFQNNSFTIDGQTVVWTTTTATNSTTSATTESTTSATTESTTIGASGTPRVSLVAVKSVLGGRPEQYATFYNTAPLGVYKDTDGSSFIAGQQPTIKQSSDEDLQTTQLRFANYLTHFGGQIALAERNPIPYEGSHAVSSAV